LLIKGCSSEQSICCSHGVHIGVGMGKDMDSLNNPVGDLGENNS